MKNQDWKIKYSDLKLKFHDAVDVAFRLGFEQGASNAQIQQAQQAQQQVAQQGQTGQISQDPSQKAMDVNSPESPDGSELDQHINTLESMLQKSDPTSSEALELKKSLEGIKAFKSSLKKTSDLKKSQKAIESIGNSMGSFTISKGAAKNMSEPAQKALSMQEQIVSDLMKAMDEEEKKASESITKTLDLEQLIKI